MIASIQNLSYASGLKTALWQVIVAPEKVNDFVL